MVSFTAEKGVTNKSTGSKNVSANLESELNKKPHIMAKPREIKRTIINRRIQFFKQKLLKGKQWLLVMGSSLILPVFINKQNRFCRQSFVLI